MTLFENVFWNYAVWYNSNVAYFVQGVSFLKADTVLCNIYLPSWDPQISQI